MARKLLPLIGGGLIAAAVALAAVGAATGWPGGQAVLNPAGMMGAPWTTGASGQKPISIDQAQRSVQAVLDQQGNGDLAIDEVIEFQDNFYAIVKEKSTGRGAFEVLVNRYNGVVSPEPGPNMMWNTKYGMMAGQGGGMIGVGSGMMGGVVTGSGMMGYGASVGPMTVSADLARKAAQQWLDQNQPGSTTEQPDTFYGYCTVHFRKDGHVSGMLSVNGYTGQVWYHSWHGSFIQEKQVAG
jgi:hypothetical protein